MCKTLPSTGNRTVLREGANGQPVEAQLVYPPLSTRPKANADPSLGESGGASVKLTNGLVSMKEVNKKVDEGRLWIIVHDCVYDVTEYKDKHPGGELVLQHLAGKDATDAFENYHRAHVAKYLLPAFFVGRLQDPFPLAPHVKDFRALRQELLSKGMFEVPSTYYKNLYLWLASLLVGALYFTLCCSSMLCHSFGAVLLGVFWQQFAGLGHDLGHSSVSKSFKDDHWFGSIIGASLTGLSTAWWKSSHNTHHVVPNSVEHDPDIQHMPLLAISEKVIEQPYWSTYHKKMFYLDAIAAFFVGYQHIIFFPMMAMARFNLYAQGLIFLIARTDKVQTTYRHYELFSIFGVFLVWYSALVSTLPTWTERVVWVLLSHAVTAVLHLQIVISHWSMETYRSTTSNPTIKSHKIHGEDWYLLQLATTMDISCPKWLDWAHIGLQFQSTHHLFPTLPRPHLRDATAMVKKVCEKHGIQFYEKGFFSMLGDSLRVLEQTAATARSGKYTTQHSLWQAWNAVG